MGKYDVLKEAIMYASQKPEVLANILVDSVDDKVTSIKITGADSITIPSADSTTSTYTAKAFSQFGEEMSNTVTLSLKGTTTGVSISSGVVTVASTTTATKFTVKATVGSVSQEKVVTLKQAPSAS